MSGKNHSQSPALDLSEKLYNSKIVGFIKSLQRNLNLETEEMRDILRLTPEQFESVLNCKGHLTAYQFADLAKRFHFSLENFNQDRIDMTVIQQHYGGNQSYISEKYTTGAFSKKIMVINVLNYVERFYAKSLRADAMDYFQVNDSIYEDRDGMVNFVFFEDLINYLKSRGLNETDVTRIGAHTIRTNEGTPFAREMAKFSSPKEMYEIYMTELIKTVEQNNAYKLIRLCDDFCVIESHENHNLLDIFKVHHIGDPARCTYRVGALAAATNYMGLPSSDVVETTCVHNGDPVCTFHINFERPAHHLRSIQQQSNRVKRRYCEKR